MYHDLLSVIVITLLIAFLLLVFSYYWFVPSVFFILLRYSRVENRCLVLRAYSDNALLQTVFNDLSHNHNHHCSNGRVIARANY